jgi:hypothetical protein
VINKKDEMGRGTGKNPYIILICKMSDENITQAI